MPTRVIILLATALGSALAQERTFGSGGSGLFSGTTEGPIYQPIQGLASYQHGYTLIDPKYAVQYAQDVKRPALSGNNKQRPQDVEYQKQLEAQDAFIRQVAEANKIRERPTLQEFRPSQPAPLPALEVQDFRFPTESQPQQSDLGSGDFLRNPLPQPPPPQSLPQPKLTVNLEQRPSFLRQPPPLATPPPPPPPSFTNFPSIQIRPTNPPPPSFQNFPSIQIQPTNPPLAIPELTNQDLPEHPPTLFSQDQDNNGLQTIDFQRTHLREEPQAVTPRAPVVRHRARPVPQTPTHTRGPSRFESFSDESVSETEKNMARAPPTVHKKRIQVVKKPVIVEEITSDIVSDNNDQTTFNEEVAKKQASGAQYEFQSSIQDSVNGQEQIRQETRDGLRLKGLYSYSDGFFKRTVYYVADENGYRVVKEESEPIGNGPQYDPDGQVNVETSFGGSGHGYTITGKQLEDAKRKTSSSSVN